MRYRALNVIYRQQGDNKCQFGPGGNPGMIINRLFSYAYVIDSLAQKLHYFWSPIKNTYW